MPDLAISQVTLPDGKVYRIKDANTSLSSSYDSNTKTVILSAGSLSDADNTEY